VSGEGQATVDIVVRHCLTREQQDKAIAALSFKCDIVVDAGRHRTRGGQAMKTLGTDSVPPLRRGVRLTYDKFRQAHVLLFPEGVLVLNATATAVLELCDGIATVEVITTALRGRYSCVRDQEVADVLTRFGQRLLSNGSEAGRTSAGHAGRTDPPLPAPLPVLRESSPATTR
jgi:pyrroloquinoline quinone biosynthesis protein D